LLGWEAVLFCSMKRRNILFPPISSPLLNNWLFSQMSGDRRFPPLLCLVLTFCLPLLGIVSDPSGVIWQNFSFPLKPFFPPVVFPKALGLPILILDDSLFERPIHFDFSQFYCNPHWSIIALLFFSIAPLKRAFFSFCALLFYSSLHFDFVNSSRLRYAGPLFFLSTRNSPIMGGESPFQKKQPFPSPHSDSPTSIHVLFPARKRGSPLQTSRVSRPPPSPSTCA